LESTAPGFVRAPARRPAPRRDGEAARLANATALASVLARISEQADRATHVVRRVHDFVRKGEIRQTRFDLNEALRAVLELLAHPLRAQGIRVELRLARSLPRVSADRTQVEQVTLNLLRNGMEAMQDTAREKRELVLSSRRFDGGVEVTVTDRGEGLPADGGEQVFETFFTTKPDGMGLGLSLSRSIIEAHGGELTAGPGPEGGARFRFTLPVADA